MALSLPTPDEVRAMRLRLGLTQAELARLAGVSQPLIARIEGGTVDPRYSTLKAVIEALNRTERQEITLGDIMTAPVLSIKATDTVQQAIALMREKGISQLPVTQKGSPIGSLSDRIVLHALSLARDPAEVSERQVKEIMGPPFAVAERTTGLDQAMRILEDQPAILVIEQGRMAGMVTKANVLNVIEKAASEPKAPQ
ncbi:MAG TPA: CBS domain-containing protein [Candidatus Thermoplasmatota archaeon]|nr:CBS domain-containing protein [Candidatus Thermoplasmatota archaeon]